MRDRLHLRRSAGLHLGRGPRGGRGALPAEVLALTQEYGISARLTFSNSLLRPEHLSDRKCNAVCQQFAQRGTVQNGVIVHSELLLNYLQNHYPELYLVSSTTKVLTDPQAFQAEVRAGRSSGMSCRTSG